MEPIISIKEARKLLGKKYEKLTDDQVAKLIDETHEFAKLALEVARQRRTSMKNDLKAFAELTYKMYKEDNSKTGSV